MPVTKYIWDPESGNVLQETDEFGATTATYTQEPGEFGSLISQNRGGTKSYYHFDALGSTRELTDENENVTDTNMYDAWGVNVASSGTTENPFRWVGEVGYYLDNEIDEYYVRARMYKPTIARFTAKDPLESPVFDKFAFAFVYAANSPLSRADASGLLSQKTVTLENVPPELGDDLNLNDVSVGPCGRFWWRTRWIPGPKEQNGIIIQRVEVGFVNVRICSQETRCIPAPFFKGSCVNHDGLDAVNDCKGVYHEVWRVKDGKVYINNVFDTHPRSEFPFDVFAWPGCKNACTNATSGHIVQRGDAFFVPDAKWKAYRKQLRDAFKKGKNGVKNACDGNSACSFKNLSENPRSFVATCCHDCTCPESRQVFG